MSIANYETLVANACAVPCVPEEAEAVPRMSDLDRPRSIGTGGKLELEYAGRRTAPSRRSSPIWSKRACKAPSSTSSCRSRAWRRWWSPSTRAGRWRCPQRRCRLREYLEGLDEIQGLREAALRSGRRRLAGALASAIEFILEGLHLSTA